MQIKIFGNSEFYLNPYYSNDKIKFLEYKILGEFGQNYTNENYRFSINDTVLETFTWNNLYNFSYEIRGFPFEKTLELLKKQEFNHFFDNKTFLTYQDIGLIKALFNILIYLEYALSIASEVEIRKDIFDNFILDVTDKLGAQRDIYFLPEEYNNDTNIINELELLMRINLLCKLTVNVQEETLTSYFLPFIKPGINFNTIEGIKKNLLNDSYKLYKKLLNHRDNCLTNFVDKKWK